MSRARNTLVGAGAAGILGLVVSFTGLHEGLELKSYQDTGGVWTICYGETLGVKPGQTATREQCDNQLVKSLLKHNEPLTTLKRDLPDGVHLAVLDWMYNTGTGNVRQRTLWRHLETGNYTAACDELLRWRFVARRDCAKDRSCTGVWKRRQIEHAVCTGKITPEAAIVQLGGKVEEPDMAGVR